MSKLLHIFSQHARDQQVPAYKCSFELLIQSYDCKQIPVGLLHAEKMADLAFRNVFRIGFPALLLAYVSLLYLVWLRFFVFINHFWLCPAVVSQCQPVSSRSNFFFFLATLQNVNESSLLQITKIYNWTILYQIFWIFVLKNTVFTLFSCIIQNPVVSVSYYPLPFLSNVETQV